MTLSTTAIPHLRLIRSTAHSTANCRLVCTTAFRLQGARHRRGEDISPSAWRDLLTLLWSASSGSGEVLELVHDVHRSDTGQPLRYDQWLRLLQSDSARASVTAANLEVGLKAALPRLAFASVTPADTVGENWVPRAMLRPAGVRLLAPRRQGTPELVGEWTYPAALPNWKLTVPLEEPLCTALRIQCRFSSAELSDAERHTALVFQQRVAAGNLRVLHPEAPLELNSHHAGLASDLLERLQAWLKGQERGYRFEALLLTPEGMELSPFVARRVAFDLFGQVPWTLTLPDESLALNSPIRALPFLHSQGVPGVFAPASLLVESFGVAELSEPPANMPSGPGATIGTVGGKPLILPHAHLASHMLVVGGSGTGKSASLLKILQQDAMHGLGIGLIDPHGETADRLVELIPASRRDDIVWVDVDDPEYSVAINPMEGTKEQPELRPYVAGQLLHLIKNNGETTNSWGPAAENHLKHCLLLAMCHPSGGTICDAAKLLEDDGWADYLLSKTKDESIQNHFKLWRRTEGEHGYGSWRPWLLSRLHPFTKSLALRRFLQRPSTLKLGEAMDQRRILIFRLGKATLSELECQLLGTTLLLEFQRAAFARARQPAAQRAPFRLVVDEFHNFASDATPSLFREARKYNLGLVAATQSLGSLMRPTVASLKDAVLASTATKVCFRLSPADSHLLDDYTTPTFSAADLMRTRNYEAVVAMSASDLAPMRVKMLQAEDFPEADCVGPQSFDRSRYSERLEVVDAFLARRHAV